MWQVFTNYSEMNDTISFMDYQPGMSSHFRDLNLAWLRKYFYVEEMDEKVLNEPKEYIIDPGGAIYFAAIDGAVIDNQRLRAAAI